MASLNAVGIPVVQKQLASFRSYGGNIAITTNLNPFGQDSVRTATVSGIPAAERSVASFGTQSEPAEKSTLRHADFVKRTESIGDTTESRVIGGVAPDAGNQPEIALLDITTRHVDHRGERVVEQDTATDTVISRSKNTSERPGGEI